MAILVTSITVASVYSLAMLVTLVAVKCKVQLPAIVIISTFFFSFSIKLISDVLSQNDIRRII